MASSDPLISVITATYNRSNVLAYTIASLRKSTFTNWELIVVGDACTDDTEAVVASFGDDRIRFVNLAENVGDQCGPNNEGVRLARGRYIAFLSHDDLWLPTHLEVCLREIEKSGADFVHTLGLVIEPNGRNWIQGAWYEDDRSFPPTVIASLWFFKRELADQIGPWRDYRDCILLPSQEWITRVRKAGKIVRQIREITVIVINAADRPNVYERREYEENEYYFNKIDNDPDFLKTELFRSAFSAAAEEVKAFNIGLFAKAFKNLIKSISIKIGLHPLTLGYLLRYGGKGGRMKQFRRFTGVGRK